MPIEYVIQDYLTLIKLLTKYVLVAVVAGLFYMAKALIRFIRTLEED